ncbi:MAG: TonB-dependent receptor [Muribaculaceae bacterium]|nr:TonB-dependent receptor [Muribaculaceae bacterium]
MKGKVSRATLATVMIGGVAGSLNMLAGEQSRVANINESGAGELTEAQIDSIEAAAYGKVRNLDELVITAETPMVKASADKITYNVKEDPSAAGVSVLDILRKVPMVNVDGQDNITVKGQGDYKIYVNGKPEPMLSQNPGMILKAMPAEAVASVELITDPGAKYDAEGGGMIINLITEHKQRNDGVNGNINLSITNKNAMAGVKAGAKINRVNLNAGIDYSESFPGTNKAKTEDETVYFNNDAADRQIRSSSTSDQRFTYIGGNLGFSWDISDHDLFTLSSNYYNVKGHNKTLGNKTEILDIDGEITNAYSKNSAFDFRFQGVSVSAAYQHEFNRKDHYIAINYQFNFNNSSMPVSYIYSNLLNYTPRYLFEKSDINNYGREHTVQVDYSNTLNEHAKIETGVKGIFRRNTATGSSMGSNDNIIFTPIEISSSNMDQPQDILAVYGLYTAKYDKFSGSAGVRYENTRMGIRFIAHPEQDFTSHLNDVVPNANITYNFSPAQTLTASYSMRISRPSIEQLNPFRISMSDMRVQEGNPWLKSERINKVNLTYNNFGRTFGMSAAIDYTNSNNAISNIVYTDGTRIINTYANIGHSRTTSLNLFITWSPVKDLRLSLNAMGNYTDLNSGEREGLKRLSNHGFGSNLNLNANWDFPGICAVSAYGGWGSGQIQLMSKGGDFHFYGLAVSRDVLKDKSLKITLSASNCFEKYLTYKSTIYGEDFRTVNRWKNPSWNVGVTLSWNFGKTISEVRSVNSNIVNDDISGTKSTTGGFSPN